MDCSLPALHIGLYKMNDVLAAGQSSLQELLVPSPGSPRTLVGSPNGQNDAEHPSPILRWTSDGSMMEELMKALGTK